MIVPRGTNEPNGIQCSSELSQHEESLLVTTANARSAAFHSLVVDSVGVKFCLQRISSKFDKMYVYIVNAQI